MDKQYTRLGDILKAQGLLTPAQLETALVLQEEKGKALGSILTERRIISEESLAKALAFQKNLDLIDISEYDVNLHAVALINEEFARRYKLFPIDFADGKLVVAVADPLDVYAIDSVQMLTGLKILPVVATETAITDAIASYLVAPSQIKETVAEAARANEAADVADDNLRIDEDVPVVKLANTILTQAFRERASDVHIECGEQAIRVRYRVDGVLREAMRLPRHLKALLVSRFKIMSAMDIAERRRPQDGRMGLKIDGTEVQFRVASLPGVYGESIILRLLTGGKAMINLEELGLDEQMLSAYRQAFNRSYGAALVTGPTGSGKTTTLYGMLNQLNTPEKKIITVEDPIEYAMESITQIQINRKAGVDFATGLRAIVRADPDIVMVGEIRDLETAQIAVRAALTGHLVLSSLHTNDAAGALTRLIDMGIDAFLVASSIHCVLAQRLARLLCSHCKAPVEYDRKTLGDFGINTESDSITFYQAGSCRKCRQTGYRGRVGLFELLVIDEEIGKLALSGASAAEIKKVAISKGMRTLYRDGVMKARHGLVSLDEVRRVVL